MHLEQYLHAQLVCHVHELLTLLLGQAGRNEQHGRSSAVSRLQQLVFLYHEVLI